MRLTDDELAWCVDVLGISPEDFLPMRQATSDEAIDDAVKAFRAKVRSGFHRASRERHPDLTGNDPLKAEELKKLSVAYEELLLVDVPRGMVARAVEGEYKFGVRSRARVARPARGPRFTIRVRYS